VEILGVFFKFILSFALILIAARIGGEIAERYLKQPAVIGELIAGIAISPFALGGLINDPIILNFATIPAVNLPSSWGLSGLPAGSEFNVMEIISEIAVVALLFVAGVETDVRAFLRQGKTGTLVAVGGVILPFIFGYFITMLFYPGASSAEWLFMGAVLTATSIGITVRILMDMRRLHTKEGTTILVAAVIDDIIGIVILSVVMSVAVTGAINVAEAIRIAVLGFVIWFALIIIGVKFHRYVSRFLLNPFKRSGTMPIVAIIIGFLIAYLVTLVGLHPVVGAYAAGLMFAATAEKEEIIEKTRPIMLFLAPFFFCFLGMQVDVPLLAAGAGIAAILIVLATLGKIVGCYIPARLVGKLSHNGGMIVGVGMVPRGEVGLIVAGVGLTMHAVSMELFGVAVAVSVVTTLITPAMLKPFFRRQVALESEADKPPG
jgi:Kef-type K+ transport system membrane component KefB